MMAMGAAAAAEAAAAVSAAVALIALAATAAIAGKCHANVHQSIKHGLTMVIFSFFVANPVDLPMCRLAHG